MKSRKDWGYNGMLQKRTIFDFFGNVFMIYGITIAILMVLSFVVGEDAKEISTIFSMGSKGLSISTMIQFLGMVVILVGYEWVLLTDLLIKNMSVLLRTAIMFLMNILTIGIFAALFEWFPIDMPMAWIAFLISFFFCAAVSVFVSVLKEKSENKKMQDALERLKNDTADDMIS